MDKKKISIIVAVIAVILAIIAAAFAFNLIGGTTTEFDNKFMSGTFNGDVSHNKVDKNLSYSDWTDSYEDKENKISYNMSCIKGGSFIIKTYQLQNLPAPEVRTYNGVDWNIYYSQAVPTTNSNSSNSSNSSKSSNISDVYDVYICMAEVDNTSYTINVISQGKIDCDGSLFCDLYKNNIQPLLEGVSLKNADKAPQIYKVLNMSKDEFNQYETLIDQILAGNVTVSQ